MNVQGKESYLSNEDNNNDANANPGANNTTSSLEWDLIQGVSVVSPGLAEADMGEADGAPGEESSKTGQSNEPVEDSLTSRRQVHVGKRTPHENEGNRVQRASGTVDVGEALGSVTLVGKSSEGSRTTVYTRDTDGDDGDENDNVHETVKSNQSSVLASNDEGGGVGIGRGAHQTIVVGGNKKSDKGETEDVEQGDSPKDLTDSTRKGLQRVLSLSGSETNKFGTREGESGGDEYSAETLEAVLESARVVPSTSSPVFRVHAIAGTSSEDQDQGNDHEDDGGTQLDTRRPELFFGISQGAPDVD
jgi:hypothetical protein